MMIESRKMRRAGHVSGIEERGLQGFVQRRKKTHNRKKAVQRDILEIHPNSEKKMQQKIRETLLSPS